MADMLPPEPKYASFNQRMLASVIDSMIILICFTPLFQFATGGFYHGYDTEAFAQKLVTPGLLPAEFMGIMHDFFITQGFLWAWLASNFFQFLVLGVVVLLFWHFRGATPGKMLLRMKIVDAYTLEAPTNLQCILRYAGYVLSTLPLMLGFFWIAWDKKRQGWHDKLASTVVIKLPKQH